MFGLALGLSLGFELELGEFDSGGFGGLLFPLNPLLCLGQVGGLLGGLASQGVSLGRQCGHLLGQRVTLGLNHLASGGQFGRLGLSLNQAALDLAPSLGCGPLNLG